MLSDSTESLTKSNKQDWSIVDPGMIISQFVDPKSYDMNQLIISLKVAWVLLISIAIECFIEGIGFGLTLQEEPGTALSLFVALLVGLIFEIYN